MNESKPGRRAVALAIAAALCGLADSPTAFADTLPGALAQAYVNNPTLNAQRAALRATDEGVPIALSGYRPTVKGTIVAGENDQFQTLKTPPTGAPGPRTANPSTQADGTSSQTSPTVSPPRRRSITAFRPRTARGKRRVRSPPGARRCV